MYTPALGSICPNGPCKVISITWGLITIMCAKQNLILDHSRSSVIGAHHSERDMSLQKADFIVSVWDHQGQV